MSKPNLAAMADQVQKLSTADKLRLAAGLLERGSDMAESVAELALQEIQLKRLLKRPEVSSPSLEKRQG